MADSLIIDASQLKNGSAALSKLIAGFPKQVSEVLDASAEDVVLNAKLNAPYNLGTLWKFIIADTDKPLVKHVTVKVPYAAYIEFGTGKFAAQTVSAYPENYQAFAAQFRGPAGGGNFKEFVMLLAIWVQRKGIAKGKDVNSVAYAIARSIIKNGVHPHPFLIPALIRQQPILIRDMETLINNLKIV